VDNRDTTRSQAFTYDQVNRIVTAQTPAPCGSNCWSQAFTYDQWANLQSVAATGTAPALAPLNVNTNNRVTLVGFNYGMKANLTFSKGKIKVSMSTDGGLDLGLKNVKNKIGLSYADDKVVGLTMWIRTSRAQRNPQLPKPPF
jgi:hypothetical protein